MTRTLASAGIATWTTSIHSADVLGFDNADKVAIANPANTTRANWLAKPKRGTPRITGDLSTRINLSDEVVYLGANLVANGTNVIDTLSGRVI